MLQFTKFQESKIGQRIFVADEFLKVFCPFWSRNFILLYCDLAVELKKCFNFAGFKSQPRNFHAANMCYLKVCWSVFPEISRSDRNLETEKINRSGFSTKNLICTKIGKKGSKFSLLTFPFAGSERKTS